MGWCHDCVGISSCLQHKELELTKATTALFVILLLVCHRKQEKGPGPCAATCISRCVILSISKGAAPHPSEADGCNKEKNFWVVIQLLEICRAAKLLAEPRSGSEKGIWWSGEEDRQEFCYFHCSTTELTH